VLVAASSSGRAGASADMLNGHAQREQLPFSSVSDSAVIRPLRSHASARGAATAHLPPSLLAFKFPDLLTSTARPVSRRSPEYPMHVCVFLHHANVVIFAPLGINRDSESSPAIRVQLCHQGPTKPNQEGHSGIYLQLINIPA